MKWISVEDRLPDDGVEVLDQDCNKVHYYRKKYYKYSFNNCWFERSEDGDIIAVDGITHWMPKPKPPDKQHEQTNNTKCM